MSVWAWCYEGRHEGTTPKYSRPCPGRNGDVQCECECHHKASKTPKFPRKKR